MPPTPFQGEKGEPGPAFSPDGSMLAPAQKGAKVSVGGAWGGSPCPGRGGGVPRGHAQSTRGLSSRGEPVPAQA